APRSKSVLVLGRPLSKSRLLGLLLLGRVGAHLPLGRQRLRCRPASALPRRPASTDGGRITTLEAIFRFRASDRKALGSGGHEQLTQARSRRSGQDACARKRIRLEAATFLRFTTPSTKERAHPQAFKRNLPALAETFCTAFPQ